MSDIAAQPLSPSPIQSTRNTQGPWEFDKADYLDAQRDVSAVSRRLNGGYIIARLHGPDRVANAQLIAAAPDLLAALKYLTDMARTTGGTPGPDIPLMAACLGAEEAMAKATGASFAGSGDRRPLDDAAT